MNERGLLGSFAGGFRLGLANGGHQQIKDWEKKENKVRAFLLCFIPASGYGSSSSCIPATESTSVGSISSLIPVPLGSVSFPYLFKPKVVIASHCCQSLGASLHLISPLNSVLKSLNFESCVG